MQNAGDGILRKMRLQFFVLTSLVQLLSAILIAAITMLVFKVPGMPYLGYFLCSCAVMLLYSYISVFSYFHTLKKDSVSVIRFYMIHTMLRFVVCGGVMLLIGYLFHDIRPYLIGFCIYFLLTLVAESMLFVHVEKRVKMV